MPTINKQEDKQILVENELPVAVVENNDNFVKESESVTLSVTSSTDITVGGVETVTNIPKVTVQQTWKPYVSSALGIIRAFDAGATTYLLHNSRKVSQMWNLTNALCRAALGPMFELTNPTFRSKVLLEIWKIVCNGSYIITTLDVNKLNTIFNDENVNYDINQFPNLKPFSAFEISATAGALSGVIGLAKLLCTTEGSTANKSLENIQKPLDFVCPAAELLLVLGFI